MACPLLWTAIISSVNLVQNLGGHQGEAQRAELRAEASRPVGPRGGGVLLGTGMCPLHKLYYLRALYAPAVGSGRSCNNPNV